MRTLYIHGSADHYGSAKILLDILRIPGNAEKAFVVLPHDGLLVKDLQELNIPVQIMNLGVLRRRYMTPWGMTGRIFLWMIAIVRLKRLISQQTISRVYVNSANVILGPALKKKNSIQLTWHIHEIVDQPAVLTNTLAWLFSKADRLIAVSKATRDFWIEKMQQRGKTNRNIELLYNGLDTTPFESVDPNRKKYCPAAGEQDLIIGMIGRIQPWKGQTYFLDILEEFFKIETQATDDTTAPARRAFAIIAGDAYPGYEHLQDELLEDIKKRKLEDAVFYNGYVGNTPEWMASIDLLVLPSTSPDPLPTVVLEAMASSKPVLASAQGGALEMVAENQTGLFMPLNNVQEAARILSTMVEDPKKLIAMGKNGHQRVREKFSSEAFEKGFRELLGRK